MVIVAISILAAISIVVYNGVQQRTHDAAVKSDLKRFYDKISIFEIENSYFPRQASHLDNSGFKIRQSFHLYLERTQRIHR